MAAQTNPRDLVIDILLAVNRDGEFSHIAVRGVLDKYRYLLRRDRAFIKRVSEGSIERRLELDYIIDTFSKTNVKKMKPVIRAILESAVYQIKYMDAVPDSAVCNEAVKLAKKRGFSGLAGFVNGVLRNISGNLKNVEFPSMETEPVRALSVRYSMPEWIVEKWLAQFGRERCERMLAAFLKKHKTCVRVDTAKCPAEEVRASLEAQGISVEPVRLAENVIDDAFYIDNYDVLDEIPEFESGILYVQDVSSMMVARLAAEELCDGGKLELTKSNTMTDFIENASIFALDVCAAPGGKSIHLAQLLRGCGRVEARDLTEYKTELIEENKERCGTDNLSVKIWDATVFDAAVDAAADIVLADLPCSGLGVIGGKTDIKYKASPEKIVELSQLQRQILSTVKRYVKPDGILLYSTCTITEEENRQNLAWFLQENPQFTLDYERQFLPDEGCDGFYIARLRLAAEKTDIKSMPYDALERWILSVGEKKFRARQLYQWMHEKHVDSLDAMGNLPAALKEKIRETCEFTVLKQVTCQVSAQDGTCKYLFALADGNMVESVLMRYQHGNSVCISSQVGCRMGCRFCASTLDGLVRNLTPAEMLEQIYRISADTGERVSNVVVMGTGEPLDNYENLLIFIRMLTDENGLHISQRNLTVSTCGIVPKIRELAGEDLQITLAISLHAPTQEKRQKLMPVANAYEIHDLIAACRDYFSETGRRVTFEYSLVAGVNDRKEDAAELAALIHGLNCHVNLIPVNPIKERDFVQPDRKSVLDFQKRLEKYGINVTIRREMGRDIDGACGQLRKRFAERQEV